jgi:serine/threonine protein kinase
MSLVVAGVSGLHQVGHDPLGRLCSGTRDGRAVGVRLFERRLTDEELQLLCSPTRTSPPHSGLAAILDVGRNAESMPYVVIDADVSATLADGRVRGELLSQGEATELVVLACEALDALHGVESVYGTITPESLTRTPDGWCLIDPGLALLAVPLPPPPSATIDAILAYTAPEVLGGSACSPASDVFSLAATVVELMSGRPVAQWSPGASVVAPPQRFGFSRDALPLPEEMLGALEAALDPIARRRPAAVALGRSASSVPTPRSADRPPAELPSSHADVLDDDVQFTVYRPHAVQPGRWYSLLAFAHKSEPFVDEVRGPIDPMEEVRRQATARLGDDFGRYATASDDSSQQLPRGSSLSFVPEVDGVEFNPPRRTFLWLEPVHEEEFRMRAEPRLDGQRARGRLSVYFGSILIAEVSLTFRVSSGEDEPAVVREESRPYRKIFISYSHADQAVVEQVETFLSVVGDRFLRDSRDLRAGEVWEDGLARMIEEADVFQLFWSTNSMRSPFVRREWTYALALNRTSFVRPTYWETPMPELREQNLPPEELRRLHFRYLPAAIGGQTPVPPPAPPRPPPRSPGVPSPGAARRTEPAREAAPAKPRRSSPARLAGIGTAVAGVLAAALVVVSSAVHSGGAQPAASRADFDRSAIVVSHGHGVQVGGPIACRSNDTIQLQATVNQPANGASAVGSWSARCQGAPQHWKTVAAATYGPPFVAGCARATGLALINHAGQTVHRLTWQNQITLTVPYAANPARSVGC